MKKSFLKHGIERAQKKILAANHIVIVCHINPDGDTIGSLLALGRGLLQMDKHVVMVSHDGCPSRFQFLPGSELILTCCRRKPELAIAVDCGSLKQIGPLAHVFKSAKSTIQIDHHDFGEAFCDVLVVDTEAAAVGEVVYELLKRLEVPITPAIATCLLTSIITDTGAFRFPNVRSRTFRLCADLIDKGADLKYLLEEAYLKKSVQTMKLEAICVQKLKIEMEGKLVWAVLRQSDFKRVNGIMADVDHVTDDLRLIDGVKVAVLLREQARGTFRVSLRSDAGINVARIAQQFGGGGHYNAAGCVIKGALKHRQKLLSALYEAVS